MIVAGLTGSIAMGKSTVAAMVAALGAPVFDADAAVRELYAGETGREVEAAFPGVLVGGAVDRGALGARVLGVPAALRRLEQIVHPAVARRRVAFLARAREERRRLAVLDIPLLFETGAEGAVDLVVVVSAPVEAQRTRALARPGMSEERLAAILARQTPDHEKRRRAHWVIDTGRTLEDTRAAVAALLRAVAMMTRGRPADA